MGEQIVAWRDFVYTGVFRK